ncbi:MAG: sigma-70 family RNA polymerase sigma factor [Daejeonella sp.]
MEAEVVTDKKEKFIRAVQENERLIFKVATFYTDCREDRDDLVQEIIYNLWKSFDSFNQRSALSTWMYRIAMNVSIFHLKKNKKRVSTVETGPEVFNFPDTETEGYEDKMAALQKQIQHLNLFDKGILMLYLESKSHEEIAEIVGISKSNVGTKLSRIKEKLKKQIAEKR